MKKLFLSLIIGLALATGFTVSTAEAAYCDQFNCRTDYTYTCDFSRSVRQFKFDGNGYDRYGNLSRCYNSERHEASRQVSDNRFLYDQFGYNEAGLDQGGRDTQGKCVRGRCETYHYRSYDYYYGERTTPPCDDDRYEYATPRSSYDSNYRSYRTTPHYKEFYRYQQYREGYGSYTRKDVLKAIKRSY